MHETWNSEPPSRLLCLCTFSFSSSMYSTPIIQYLPRSHGDSFPHRGSHLHKCKATYFLISSRQHEMLPLLLQWCLYVFRVLYRRSLFYCQLHFCQMITFFLSAIAMHVHVHVHVYMYMYTCIMYIYMYMYIPLHYEEYFEMGF